MPRKRNEEKLVEERVERAAEVAEAREAETKEEKTEEKPAVPSKVRKRVLSEKESRLLSIRERIREARPRFVRQESWRYKRLEGGWRRPQGIDSKMRRQIRGVPKLVAVGYGSPNTVRGVHPSGFEEVVVYNVKDLESLNPEKQAARIAHTVGTKKRVDMLEKARELKVVVLNPIGVKSVEPKEPEKTSG
jgi:large subunit ribosomal protein L32e